MNGSALPGGSRQQERVEGDQATWPTSTRMLWWSARCPGRIRRRSRRPASRAVGVCQPARPTSAAGDDRCADRRQGGEVGRWSGLVPQPTGVAALEPPLDRGSQRRRAERHLARTQRHPRPPGKPLDPRQPNPSHQPRHDYAHPQPTRRHRPNLLVGIVILEAGRRHRQGVAQTASAALNSANRWPMARPAWPPPTTATSNRSGARSHGHAWAAGPFWVVIVSPGRLGGPCSPAATAAAPAQLGVRCTWCPLLDSSQTAPRSDWFGFPMSPRVNGPTVASSSGQYKIAWAVHVSRRAPSRSSVRPVAALPGMWETQPSR